MSIRAVITGATGMVGEAVLHECLQHPEVESVLVINRRPCNVQHAKLRELLHADFSDFTGLESALAGYNAGFLCMGVTSIGKSEKEYYHLTYDMTMALARVLSAVNPDVTLCYVSGAGTDSTEQGSIMWARVKGKTENHLLGLPVRAAYMFRPAYLQPTKGLKHAYKLSTAISPFYPFLKRLFPKYVLTLHELGQAMIHCVGAEPGKRVLEVPDIRGLV